MSIITTLEQQCRALTSTTSPDEDASRFLVGTLSPNGDNLLYVFEYKDDNNNLAKVTYKFPYGELWHLSSSTRYPTLAAAVTAQRGKHNVGIYKLPDELKQSIEDDYGLSESPIELQFQPIVEAKDPFQQSLWHPDDGNQLLTCNDGHIQIWDIEHHKEVRKFSLLEAAERCLDLKLGSIKRRSICDLRWSSLFDCSVVAAAVGSKIYGVDTRISDSSPTAVCWLIEDQRCNRIRSIDFNPNSQYYIASGGDDCRANFWDLRQTGRPALRIQSHSHWIWSLRYNPFHDQLVLSAGSDGRVVLMRAQSVASDPYGQVAEDDDDDDDDDNGEILKGDELKGGSLHAKETSNNHGAHTNGDESSLSGKKDKVELRNEVIGVFDDHDDSVYAAEWAVDPWIFASLGFDSRLVISRVPKAEKFSILF